MSAGRSFGDFVRSRAAFVPLLEDLAPRVEGVTRAEMTADATLWASAIERAATLVGADAVTIGWDASILAEACGVDLHWEDDRPVLGAPPPTLSAAAKTSARVPAFLEAARRLTAAGRERRACVVAIPGPANLAAHALGTAPDKQSIAALKATFVAIAEALCQSRPDALVLVENGHATAPSPEVRRIYATVRNVADYYGVAAASYVERYDDVGSAAASAASLRIDHLMVGANHVGVAPDAAAVVRAAANLGSVAVPLALDDAESARQSAAAALAATQAKPTVYFTTPGPVPCQSDIGLLREVGEAVRAIVHASKG